MKRDKIKSERPSAPISPVHPPFSSPTTWLRSHRLTDEMLYAQPASVHFGSFALDRSVHQRVRVHNNSAKAVRLRYTFPSGKKGFRATFVHADRPSFVSAGLCEEILVTFAPPAGFEYYYDCIQVYCEEVAYGSSTDVARSGATLIPLHAYPMVNEVAFPTRMDFGIVPRGTCARKHVDITCSVPVEFEYELQITKAHPAFTVFPLTGIIPPRGEARIELEFRPLAYATASAELELRVSQLGFIARVCTLAGSSTSTADVSLANTTREPIVSAPALPLAESKPRHRHEAQVKTSQSSTPRDGSKSRSRKSVQQFDDADEEEELENIQGIEIPHNLNSVTGVAYVLTQEPGRLKPKHLKKAIAANRALRLQQREEQAKLSAEIGYDGEEEDPSALSFQNLVREEERFLERVRVSKQVKDMFFQQELREVAETEKTLELYSHKVHLGQRLLSHEQIAHLFKLRELNSQTLAFQQREQLRTMFIDVFYEPPNMVSDHQHRLSDDMQPLLPGEVKGAVLPAHFVPTYTPDFKLYKNNLWERRQRVLRRLVRGVSTCILRLRAQKRLDRIHEWLGAANTRVQVQEKVTLDWQLSAQASGYDNVEAVRPDDSGYEAQGSEQPNLDSVLHREQCQIYLSSFPMVEESLAQKRREAIVFPADWELKFNSFTFMELKPRDEALLMGHEPLPLPAVPTYVPLESDRMIRHGAEGECDVVTPLLQSSDSEADSLFDVGHPLATSVPSLLEMMPPDVFLRPQASVRPLVELQGPRETEPSYALRPRRVFHTPPSHFSAWQNSQVGLQSVTGSHDEASLHMSDSFVGSAGIKHVEPAFLSPTESAKSKNNLSLFGDVWNVAAVTTPLLAERAEDVPCLSDSDSDDDGDGGIGNTSWQHALELFEDAASKQDDGESNDICEQKKLLGCNTNVSSLARYQCLIAQERAYSNYRQELQERLPKLLESVSKLIEDPDQALVVRGHGHERPLHISSQ